MTGEKITKWLSNIFGVTVEQLKKASDKWHKELKEKRKE